ncbi:MAG: NADH-quinone oxidoreductase subunit NuoG [Chthonomonadales bacterium]
MSETSTVKLKIDGHEVVAPVGEKVIEAAKRIGVDVPFFCYHPRLSMEDGGANCRMCLVEVASPRKNPDGSVSMAKFPKPQTACSLPVSEGMEIWTETESLIKDRRGILEFLLINHPLDCPICDRGGECPLQNNTIHYGPPTTRFIEEKRHFPKAYPLSNHVVFDRERCIHCARCTRFTTDISGDSQLNFLYRGADMEVSTFDESDFSSRFSGNVIELCPVGALLSRNYRFKARPWDLMTQKSICTQCSNGCNIKVDYRVGNLQRVNARENDAVNEEWTCDAGKFGMDYVSSDDRITKPLIRKGNTFVESTWDEANALISAKIAEAGGKIGGIGGSRSSNEDLFMFQKFFREVLGVNNIDHRMGPYFGSTHNGPLARFGGARMNNSIADLETMKTIFVFGSNLVDEQPILFLRVRKTWRNNGCSIVEAVPSDTAADQPNHVKEFASVSMRYAPGTEVALILGLINVMNAEKLIGTDVLASSNFASIEAEVKNWTPEATVHETGLTVDAIHRAARLLATEKCAVIVGNEVTNHPQMEAVLNALGNLVVLTGNSDNLSVPVTTNNGQGAIDLGILPDAGPGYIKLEANGLNTGEMLSAAASGALKMLWVVGADPVAEFHDTVLVENAFENCEFAVVHAWNMNKTAQMANVILPVNTVVEKDGTFTNVEGRVQRFYKAFEISPEIHAEWVIFQELASRMGVHMPYFSSRDIIAEIASNVPGYENCGLNDLGDTGVRRTVPAYAVANDKVVVVEYKGSELAVK